MKRRPGYTTLMLLVSLALLAVGCAKATPSPVSTPSPGAPTTAPAATAKPSPTTAPSPVAPAPAQQASIKWNMQSDYPLNSTVTPFIAQWYASWVDAASNGRIQTKVNAPGTFAPVGELGALSKGIYNVGAIYGASYIGVMPEANVESSLPMSYMNAAELWDAFYNRGLLQLFREAYAERNIYYVAPVPMGGPYHFMTTFPFRTLDDIKGKKIRAAGAFARYVQELGGSPVNIAGGEMYMAMKLGTIDGAIFAGTTLKSYKLAEVVKYYVEPAIVMNAMSILINMDDWKKLPEDIRKTLERDSRYVTMASHYDYSVDSYNVVPWAKKEYGVQFVNLSDADLKIATKASLKWWDEVAAMSPRTAKMVDIIKKQMKDYGRLE